MEVRGELAGVRSLLTSCGSWGSNAFLYSLSHLTCPLEAFSVGVMDVSLLLTFPGETTTQSIVPSQGQDDVDFHSFTLSRWGSAVLETLGLTSLT